MELNMSSAFQCRLRSSVLIGNRTAWSEYVKAARLISKMKSSYHELREGAHDWRIFSTRQYLVKVA